MQSMKLLVLATILVGTLAFCPPEVDKAIRKYWETNPPSTGMPQKLLGESVFITAPSSVLGDHEELLTDCQTEGVLYKGNDTINPWNGALRLKEIEPGLIKYYNGIPRYDLLMYVISYSNNVLVRYQCEVNRPVANKETTAWSVDYPFGIAEVNPPYAAISVVNPKSQDLSPYQNEIKAGYETLKKIGLSPHQEMKLNCIGNLWWKQGK